MPIAKKKPRKVYLPMDFMTPTEKRKYLKKQNGKVEINYMYNRLEFVKPIEEIEELPLDKGQEYLLNVMNTHSTKSLREHWNVTGHYYYKKLLPKFQIVVEKGKKPYVDNSTNKQETRSTTIVNNNISTKQSDEIVLQKIITERVEEEVEKRLEKKLETILMNINDVYNGKELASELTDIGAFFERKENNKYHIQLIVTKK